MGWRSGNRDDFLYISAISSYRINRWGETWWQSGGSWKSRKFAYILFKCPFNMPIKLVHFEAVFSSSYFSHIIQTSRPVVLVCKYQTLCISDDRNECLYRLSTLSGFYLDKSKLHLYHNFYKIKFISLNVK